jgi:tetratricopeptide (TPR) repeat protein
MIFDATGDDGSEALKIQKIYIQSFTGQNVQQAQEVFFETAAEQHLFDFVELLPDDYTDLKILRVNVTDYSIWETNEKLDLNLTAGKSAPAVMDQVLRRNAIVGFKVSLFEAETGKLLLRKPYTQPFQQIYVGSEEIRKMPEKSQELKRLAKILVYRLLTDFYQAKAEPLVMELEKGHGYDFISRYIYNLGDKRIKKGNRLAEIDEYDRAIWLWQLVLYKPDEDEPLDIYKKNRASAYYNLGVIYHKLGDWLKAADMYSMANRMVQDLKYAQAWGKTMQMWLDAKKGKESLVDEISPKQDKEAEIAESVQIEQKKPEEEAVSESEILKSMEKNEQLLLKARELWPLEPALKFAEPPTMSPTPETKEPSDKTLPDTREENLVKPMEMDDLIFEDDLIKQVPEPVKE